MFNQKNKIINHLILFFILLGLFLPVRVYKTKNLANNESPFKNEHIVQVQKNNPFSLFTPVQAESISNGVEPLKEFTPNTSNRHPQWNHNMMNIGQAWADGYTGKGVKIAVLDTGFFIQHPDSNIVAGDSVFADDPWSNDHSGHGTHIAGIISAQRGSQFQGIAPGAEVYGIKIYHEEDVDDEGGVSTTVQSVIRGIELAIELEVDIILISSGLSYHDLELYDVIKTAHDLDIMIIAASGNGQTSVNYPASYSEVIAVTAVDDQLNPALDIIYGQENDFSAPGVHIGGLSIPDSTYSYPYIYMSGSSQAAPHAAGLAAILMEKYGKHGEAIREIMQEQSISIGDQGLYGHGLLQYVSDDEDKNNILAPINPEGEPTEESSQEVTPQEIPDMPSEEARKPASSREADTPIEDEDLVEFNYTDIIENAALGTIETDAIYYVDNGGTLEVNMNEMNSLFLTRNQVAQFRHRNLSIVLRTKDKAAWTIPPGNLLPGSATLRFYKGSPSGVNYDRDATFGLRTISIYQEATRRDAYPSWMQISYDIDSLNAENVIALQAQRWDNENDRWEEIDREIENGQIVLKTRYTTTVSFVDPDLIIAEEVVEEQPEGNKEEQRFFASNSFKMIIGLIVFGLLLFLVRHFMKKKPTK